LRIPVVAVAFGLAFAWGGSDAMAWGPVAQAVVTAKAIDALPKGLKEFYKAHRLEMPTLALEPTFPEDGPDRRFAVDRLTAFPFADLPHTEKGIKEKYGDAANIGRLPWLLQESYARLVEAFKSRDKTRILEESDALAALVAQMHNPLALTDNADGQKSEQHGLYQRFSSRFPEAVANKLKVNPDAGIYLDEPKEYVFSILNATYVWVDNLLFLDELSKRGKSGYGDIYFEDMAGRATDFLSRRLSLAANDCASYWYTAWTDAQRPELK
jgi:hypothetical protein